MKLRSDKIYKPEKIGREKKKKEEDASLFHAAHEFDDQKLHENHQNRAPS
jgi:hypothetical protein